MLLQLAETHLCVVVELGDRQRQSTLTELEGLRGRRRQERVMGGGEGGNTNSKSSGHSGKEVSKNRHI